ncbi:Uncharacterised protein [Vibrio cholerae]|nr:Uncharacterised protein [Vibrio cholerae]
MWQSAQPAPPEVCFARSNRAAVNHQKVAVNSFCLLKVLASRVTNFKHRERCP